RRPAVLKSVVRGFSEKPTGERIGSGHSVQLPLCRTTSRPAHRPVPPYDIRVPLSDTGQFAPWRHHISTVLREQDKVDKELTSRTGRAPRLRRRRLIRSRAGCVEVAPAKLAARQRGSV